MTDVIHLAMTATSSPESDSRSLSPSSSSGSPLHMPKVAKTLSPSVPAYVRDSDKLPLPLSLCPRLMSPPLKGLRSRSHSDTLPVMPPLRAPLPADTVLGMMSESRAISVEDRKLQTLATHRSADTLVAHAMQQEPPVAPMRPRSKSVSAAAGAGPTPAPTGATVTTSLFVSMDALCASGAAGTYPRG